MSKDQKSIVRAEVRLAICSHTEQELLSESQEILGQLECLEQFKSASVVAMYWSLNDEVRTHEFIEKWCAQKTILLPAVDGDDMSFSVFNSVEDMCSGSFNIAEPRNKKMLYSGEIDVIVVPGVAFDRKGHRLGRGKGYYDRYLVGSKAYKVGVCYECQCVQDVPTTPLDVTMDCVLTRME